MGAAFLKFTWFSPSFSSPNWNIIRLKGEDCSDLEKELEKDSQVILMHTTG